MNSEEGITLLEKMELGSLDHWPNLWTFLPPCSLTECVFQVVLLYSLTELLIVPQVKELSALQKELIETKQALANANQDKDKLFRELRKYNPFFEL